jgi:hypothetical protein
LPPSSGRLSSTVGTLPPNFGLPTTVVTEYFSNVKLYKTNFL